MRHKFKFCQISFIRSFISFDHIWTYSAVTILKWIPIIKALLLVAGKKPILDHVNWIPEPHGSSQQPLEAVCPVLNICEKETKTYLWIGILTNGQWPSMMIQVSINVRLYLLSGSERLLFWEDGLAYIVTVFGYLGFGLNLYVDIGSKVIRC